MMIYVILLQIFFALTFIIFKKTLLFAPPFFVVSMRMLIAALILLSYQFIVDKDAFKKLKGNLRLIMLGSILNIYFQCGFELWGMQYITAAKASFIYNFAPFISAFLSYMILNETMSIKKWIGVVIGFIGFLPILFNELPLEASTCHIALMSSADIALIVAAISSAYGWICLKQLIYRKHFPIALANGITMFIGGLFTLTNSLFVENWTPVFSAPYLPFWGYTLLGVLLSQIVCFNLYAWLLKDFTATYLTFSNFIMPFFTALFGWFFLGEIISWQFLISSVIVFVGLHLFYKEEAQEIHRRNK